MNLTDERLKQLDDPSLSRDQHALLRCRIAAEFIHTGQYELACEALDQFWPGLGEHPETGKLPQTTRAEILLRCGTITSFLGSARQVSGSQEKAKDLLFEALRIFKSHRLHTKVSEVHYELATCYWKTGAFDESRIVLEEALKGLEDAELKSKILIRRSCIEALTGRYHDAFQVLKEAQDFFEGCNDAIKGRWHGQMGLALRMMGSAEGQADYFDRAIIEYTAAIFHYEQAGHERYCARNLNNLAFLLYKLGRYEEAHQHLNNAAEIFKRDPGDLAQVNETRARVLIAEQRYKEANQLIGGVIQTLQKGEETALLADALRVQGIVWARLGAHESSIHILNHATTIAVDAGAFASAANATLTLIEEHGSRLTKRELYPIYKRADELLKKSQDAEDVARLRECARIVTKRLQGPQLADKGFNLKKTVRAYEADFIEQALEQAGGSVTKAAKLLGYGHHGSLINILKTRHKNLLPKRKPVSRRRRVIAKEKESG